MDLIHSVQRFAGYNRRRWTVHRYREGESGILMTGIRKMSPIKERTQLNVYGPVASVPVVCATNATPQMKAASTRKNEFLILFTFMIYFLCDKNLS